MLLSFLSSLGSWSCAYFSLDIWVPRRLYPWIRKTLDYYSAVSNVGTVAEIKAKE
jgi:hypothetical protein